MDEVHLSAPRCITDLYSLFAWVMYKSSDKFYGCYGLSQAYMYDTDVTINLLSEQFSSCDPYFSIQYLKDNNLLWYKDIHQYEQKPSKKRDCRCSDKPQHVSAVYQQRLTATISDQVWISKRLNS